MDFIMNGQGTGSIANRLLGSGFDPGVLRPYLDSKGRSRIAVTQNGKSRPMPTNNADATLRKDDWIAIDKAVLKAAQPRYKLFGDIRKAGLTYSIANGMGKTVLETETQSDITDAVVDMDGLAEGDNDRPVFELENLPLPIVHKDFHYSLRQIAASRNGGSPLDTTHAELAARKVAEQVEKMTIGTVPNYSFGGGKVYGLTNFPKRTTMPLTPPDGTNQKQTLQEVLCMRDLAKQQHHYGPFNLYFGTDWDKWLDDDFNVQYPGVTLRDRLLKIQGIDQAMTLDFLPGLDVILVEKSTDTIRAVLGMDITTVQWESHGGMRVNFKVMAILVPQLRADYYGNTGIIHAS